MCGVSAFPYSVREADCLIKQDFGQKLTPQGFYQLRYGVMGKERSEELNQSVAVSNLATKL